MTKAHCLMALFSKFLVPSDQNTESVAEDFEYQASRFPEDVVQRTVQAYIDGQVEGQSGKWLPRPTEFAMACDKRMDHHRFMEKQRQVAQEAQKHLPPPSALSDEERAAVVDEVMEKHNKWFNEFEREKKPQQQFTPVTADTLGDPRPLAERLKIRDLAPAHYDVPETRGASEFKPLDPQLPTQKAAS